MKQVCVKRTVSLNNTGDRFHNPMGGGLNPWSSLDSSVCHQITCASTVTIRNLKVVLTTAPGSGISAIYTIMKNGSATALTCTISDSNIEAEDTSNDISFSDGDTISIRRSTSGGTPAASEKHISIEIESATANESIYGGHIDQLNTVAVQYVNPLTSPGQTENTNAQKALALWSVAGTLTKFRFRVHQAPGAGDSWIAVLYKNLVKQDGTGGTPDTTATISGAAQTTAVSTFSLDLAPDDLLSVEITPTGTPTNALGSIGLAFLADTDGEFVFAITPDANPSGVVANYCAPCGEGWTNTESNFSNLGGVTPFFVTGVRGRLSVADDNRTITLRVDGDTNAEATFTGGSLFANDLANPLVAIGPDSVWSVKTTPPGGGSTPFLAVALTASVDVLSESVFTSAGVATVQFVGISTQLDGEVDPGDNPEDGVLPIYGPLTFINLRLTTGDWLKYAYRAQFNDRDVWFHGKKTPAILAFSDVRRRYSLEGAVEEFPYDIVLDDRSGALRAASLAGTLKGAEVFSYWVDDSVRRAEGDPWRIAVGIVKEGDPTARMTYTLKVSSKLGDLLRRRNAEALVPNYALSRTGPSGFASMDPSLENTAAPVVLGDFTNDPEGAVHLKYLGGPANLQDVFGGAAVDLDFDVYLVSMGAIGLLSGMTYNPPSWEEDEVITVGSLIRPRTFMGRMFVCTTAGTTGSTEPTWPLSGTVADGSVVWTVHSTITTDDVRLVVPESAYGTLAGGILAPFKNNWGLGTGLATQYIDYPTGSPRRYTIVFFLRTHPYAEKIRTGDIQLGALVYGLAENPNGTGKIITNPARLIQFIIQNCITGTTDWITYAPMPIWHGPEGHYSIFDTDSVEAAHDFGFEVNPSISARAAIVLGRDGRQRRGIEDLREICQGYFIKIGENRHGQITLHVTDPTATANITYRAGLDILKGDQNFKTYRHHNQYMNRLEYVAGYRHVPSVAKGSPTDDLHLWLSGQLVDEDTAAQAQVNGVYRHSFENYVLRDEEVYEEWATRVREFWQGVSPGVQSNDGRLAIGFMTRIQGLGKTYDGTFYPVDLGSVIKVVHPESFHPTAIAKMEVWDLIIKPLDYNVWLEGPVLEIVDVDLEAQELSVSGGLSVGLGGGTGPGFGGPGF
jgi:hypothetical protein